MARPCEGDGPRSTFCLFEYVGPLISGNGDVSAAAAAERPDECRRCYAVVAVNGVPPAPESCGGSIASVMG